MKEKEIMKEIKKREEKLTKPFRDFKFERDLIDYTTVRYLKYLYHTHKNPIYAWEAYATCRKWEIEIPDWILQYLDDCAENLSTIDQPDQASDEVYRAIKFSSKTQRSPFKRRENVKLTVDIGIRSGELREKGKKPTEIDKELAKEFCLEIKTVRKRRLDYEKTEDTPLPSA